MDKIILVKPDLSYADEIIKYKEESLAESPIINGSAGLDRLSSIEDWLEELKKRSSEDKTCFREVQRIKNKKSSYHL